MLPVLETSAHPPTTAATWRVLKHTTQLILTIKQACTGNSLETCGGGNRLNVYSQGVPVQVTPVGDWTLQGCYRYLNTFRPSSFWLTRRISDDSSARALPVRQYVDGGMTVEKCTAKCSTLSTLQISRCDEVIRFYDQISNTLVLNTET